MSTRTCWEAPFGHSSGGWGVSPSWPVGHLSSIHKNIFNASKETLKGSEVSHVHSLWLKVWHTLMFLNPVKCKSWDGFPFQLTQPCHSTFYPLLILCFLESYLNLPTLPMELLHSATFACWSDCFVILFWYPLYFANYVRFSVDFSSSQTYSIKSIMFYCFSEPYSSFHLKINFFYNIHRWEAPGLSLSSRWFIYFKYPNDKEITKLIQAVPIPQLNNNTIVSRFLIPYFKCSVRSYAV